MAGLKEIRRRITSVKNTRQITRAMKLVSAAKLRRAQEAAFAGRQFSVEMQRALLTALEALPGDFIHPFLAVELKPSQKVRRRVIVVSGERGLCGAFNTNIFKLVQQNESGTDRSRDFVPIGRKAVGNAKRFSWNVAEEFGGLPEDVALWPVEEIVGASINGFTNGDVDEVYLYYTSFVSALTQKPTYEKLLPLDPKLMREKLEQDVTAGSGISSNAKLDPSPEEVFEYLAPIYIRARLREAALESKACEHAARMTAMDSATNNASDLIERLRLFYNRARQSTITRELIDIIGGASAVE